VQWAILSTCIRRITRSTDQVRRYPSLPDAPMP
jgi:hypothetical protein